MALTREQLKRLRAAQPTAAGNRLSVARDLASVTQVELAHALGIVQPQLSDWERGRYSISLDNARKLSGFFGCAIEDLFPAQSQVA